MIFEDKKKLLELYNAISGKHYEDPELLEINTLENAIYASMKNDLYTVKEEDPMLDLKVLMLNVNQGHNPELMEVCHTLWEYAEYTGRVRKYAKEQPIAEAVERAITECIREGILKEFLEKNRREAKNVSIYEYDQEKHIRQEREEAWEAGEKAGREAGQMDKLQELIQKKLAKGKTIPEIAEALEESEDVIRQLIAEL